MKERMTIGLIEAATLTGLSHWTLRKYIHDGTLRPVRIGRRVLLEPAELVRLIENGKSDRQHD